MDRSRAASIFWSTPGRADSSMQISGNLWDGTTMLWISHAASVSTPRVHVVPHTRRSLSSLEAPPACWTVTSMLVFISVIDIRAPLPHCWLIDEPLYTLYSQRPEDRGTTPLPINFPIGPKELVIPIFSIQISLRLHDSLRESTRPRIRGPLCALAGSSGSRDGSCQPQLGFPSVRTYSGFL